MQPWEKKRVNFQSYRALGLRQWNIQKKPNISSLTNILFMWYRYLIFLLRCLISYFSVVALLLVSIQLALYVDQAEGMGICFGGGYPACCQVYWPSWPSLSWLSDGILFWGRLSCLLPGALTILTIMTILTLTILTCFGEAILLAASRGAFFAWRAHILSWPRIMCSQVRMLKCLESSREMP